MGPKEEKAMKKVLLSIAMATLTIALAGCSNTVEPIKTEDCPPPPVVETVPESAGPVESEGAALSASNEQLVDNVTVKEDPEISRELDLQEELPAAPQPQKPQAPVRASVVFVAEVQKETPKDPSPAPSEIQQGSEAETIDQPPVESEPQAESEPPAVNEPHEPAFSIDHWISYAQEYARNAGLNLDPTAVDCWDNPITAGAHCVYLERDIQSRLNRYAKDDSISDVWVWAESRSDGSYDLYIGYA